SAVDGGQDLATLQPRDGAGQLVAGAESQLGSRLRRWWGNPERPVEEPAHGPRVLAAPQVHHVVRAAPGGERRPGSSQMVPLRLQERPVVEAGAAAQEELDEQLGPDIPQVVHWAVEPSLVQPTAGSGRRQEHSVTAVTSLLALPHDEALVDQS